MSKCSVLINTWVGDVPSGMMAITSNPNLTLGEASQYKGLLI